ncbi:MAG: hypothetical protein WD096_08285 [Actinomycetota bacterium]
MAKAPATSGDEPVSEGSAERSHAVCPVAWCPVCLAVTAAQPLQPEAVEHLLKAGTELLLAIRAVIDTRAGEVSGEDSSPPGPTHLEKIELG